VHKQAAAAAWGREALYSSRDIFFFFFRSLSPRSKKREKVKKGQKEQASMYIDRSLCAKAIGG
jgi:hypothetical protein